MWSVYSRLTPAFLPHTKPSPWINENSELKFKYREGQNRTKLRVSVDVDAPAQITLMSSCEPSGIFLCTQCAPSTPIHSFDHSNCLPGSPQKGEVRVGGDIMLSYTSSPSHTTKAFVTLTCHSCQQWCPSLSPKSRRSAAASHFFGVRSETWDWTLLGSQHVSGLDFRRKGCCRSRKCAVMASKVPPPSLER